MLLDSLVVSKIEWKKGRSPKLMSSLKSLDKFSSKYSRKLIYFSAKYITSTG